MANGTNGNGSPWWIKAGREFGFPVMVSMILLSAFGVLGKWMIDNQTRLIDSTVKTNESLTAANQQNSLTLQQMERSTAGSSAVVLRAVESNAELIRSHAAISADNKVLNEKQVELIEGVTKTHALQSQQLDKVTEIMQSAADMMAPVPSQRQQMLDKQDETNTKLEELIKVTKKGM